MDIVLPELLPLPVSPARRVVTVQMTRDGEQTADQKIARLVDTGLVPQAFFVTDYQTSQLFLASAVDTTWLILATDETPPARAGAAYVSIDSDLTIALDLTDGSGGGGGGQPARLAAMVRVEKLPAIREVVALERVVDGSWRVAGTGITDSSGMADLDLRVTPSGRVYALSVDDFGAPFQADLPVSVGQRIRPSVFGGWLYEITEPGVLPPTEPEWWPAQGDNASRPLGTARAIAVRYYRPLAHGPLPRELIE